MLASLPYPDKPKNGDAPDATPLLANLTALLQALQAFDGSQILSKTIAEGAFADAVNPRLRDGAWMANWIESGGYTAAFTGLGWTMPSGVSWYQGTRSPFTGLGYTVSANQDTYYFVSQAGAVTSTAVANNATAPTTPGGTQPLVKVVSGASAITSIVDLRSITPLSVGGLVKSIANSGSAGGTIYYINLGGLKLAWSDGASSIAAPANGATSTTFTLPVGFFSTITTVIPTITASGSTQVGINVNGYNPASIALYVLSLSAAAGVGGVPRFFAIGT